MAVPDEMSSVAGEIMLDNVRDRNPGISTEKLLQKARRGLYRLGQAERCYKHIEDIHGILGNTKVDTQRLVIVAKEQGTERYFQTYFEKTG